MTPHWKHRHRITPVAAAVAAGIVFTAVPASAVPGGPGVGDPYFPDDGNSGYDVSQYDVHVHYDPARPRYLEGDTTVQAVATGDLDRLHLDLEGFQVTAVTVDGTPARAVSRRARTNSSSPPQSRSRRTRNSRYASDTPAKRSARAGTRSKTAERTRRVSRTPRRPGTRPTTTPRTRRPSGSRPQSPTAGQ